MTKSSVCLPCRGGFHTECDLYFAHLLGDGQDCCCEGLFTLDDMELLRQMSPDAPKAVEIGAPGERRRAIDPGYIHPDAYRFTKSIGEFADPASTGRKLVAEMYPIKVGMVCEWANKEDCGGGVHPIIGCLGNPATDLHHGPDKNTLNNAKASWGVGDTENVHIICSFCHNRWHAVNDPTYGEYDRKADQRLPWCPLGVEWSAHAPVDADPDKLWAENRARQIARDAKGGSGGGRNAAGAGQAADTGDIDED